MQAVRDPAANVAAVPAAVQDRCQEEPERDEPEADELGVVVAARAASLRALFLPHACGRLRAQLRRTLPLPRHGGDFAGRMALPAMPGQPYARAAPRPRPEQAGSPSSRT